MQRSFQTLYFSFALMFLACAALNAQTEERGAISGIIVDSLEMHPLSGVTVQCSESAWGAYSNPEGVFFLRNIPPGNYTLLISLIGYRTEKRTVQVRAGDTTRIKVVMREQLLQTDEVIVSASKRMQAVQDVPISVASINQQTLMQRNIIRLDDALRYVPGVNINRDQVNIRGSSGFSLGLGSRVLLLLDGLPLLSGDNGEIKFDAVPIFNIERVEVIKGAGSALYGTGALGGVINIITAEPSERPEVRVRAYSGIYTLPEPEWQYRESPPYLGGIELSYSQKSGSIGWLLSGSLHRTEGHHDYLKSERWNLFYKMFYRFSPNTSVDLMLNAASDLRDNWVFWRSLRAATRPPQSVNTDEQIRSDKYGIAAYFRHVFNRDLFLVYKTGLYRTHFESTLTTDFNDSLASTADAWNNEVQLNTILARNLILTSGVGAIYNSVPESFLGDKDQALLAAYTQAEYKPWNDLTLTGGLRLDYEKAQGLDGNTHLSPKAGASYTVDSKTWARASYGTGFRSPTIGERFASVRYGSFVVQANPALLPEESWSLEAGIKRAEQLFGEDWEFDLAVFHNEFTNLIEPELPTSLDAAIQFKNITHARIQGAELGIKGWLPGQSLGIELGLTAMNPQNVDSNTTLKYRSKWIAHARAILPVDFVQFQLDYRYQSRFESIDEQVGLVIPDHDARVDAHVMDARLIANLYHFGLPMRVSLQAKNVLNYYYTEIIANLAPTRSLVLQVESKL